MSRVSLIPSWDGEVFGICISHEKLAELVEEQIERDATFRDALQDAIKNTKYTGYYNPRKCSFGVCNYADAESVGISLSADALLIAVRDIARCVASLDADGAMYELLRRMNELANREAAS